MDRRDDNFINGQFTWFTGEVLKVAKDGTNRVKVYPHGYYDAKLNNENEADNLPWATVMMPCTTAGTETSTMNHSLEKGTWVVGFFRDGPSAQDPIVMGVITGRDKPTLASPDVKQQRFQGGQNIIFDNKAGTITLAGSSIGKVIIL
tara:strand:- start:2595 stop:3035 length:441 start_codon:yes stop_codon:yes gene_type:complete